MIHNTMIRYSMLGAKGSVMELNDPQHHDSYAMLGAKGSVME